MSNLILSPGAPLQWAEVYVEREASNSTTPLMRHWQGDFYRFNGSYYERLHVDDVKAEVYRFLEGAAIEGKETKAFKPDKTKVGHFLDALPAVIHLPSRTTPPAWINGHEGPAPEQLIVFQNGVFNLRTGELEEPTHHLFAVSALPFDYNADAGAPTRWIDFMDSIWNQDPACIDSLQQIMGCIVAGDLRYQKLPIIFGPRRSGKGTIREVMQALVGGHCEPSLNDLDGDFGLECLINQKLAIVSDARPGTKVDLHRVGERLLSLSGGDNPNVNRKHRTVWEGELRVQFVIMTNVLPRLADAAGVLASRFIPLRMTKSFFNNEDKDLAAALKRELPAIFNWALEGWHRADERGSILVPESGFDALEDLERMASPVGAWAKDQCEFDPTFRTPTKDLYNDFCNWCRESNHRPMADSVFFENLKAWAASNNELIKKVRTREGAARPWVYEGIALAGADAAF